MGLDIAQGYDLAVKLMCEFAQKRAEGMNDGFMIRAPSLFFVWPRFSARGGLLVESGRLVSAEFNEFYLSRRSFYKYEQGASSPTDTLLTYNTSLWSRRQALSVFGGFGANPVKGLDVSVDLTQNFRNRNAAAYWGVVDSTTDTNVISPLDFSIEMRLAMNRDLFKYIDYAEVHLRQLHGGLYPSKGALFSSWNTEMGFSVCSARFLYDLSLEAGGRLFYLDMGPYPDDVINTDDRILEFFAGIRWDFL
jgi:hypothetical protein